MAYWFFRMFKSRSASKGNAATPLPQSVDAVRRRAKHRLIGASVLVLLGVLGFPLLFDTQPRSISVDIPIDIPAKNPAQPLAVPKGMEPQVAVQSSTPAAPAQVVEPAPKLSVNEGLGAREEVVETTRPAPPTPPEPKPVAKAAPAPKSEAVDNAKSDGEAARARALLEGKKTPSQAADSERVVVQVGAFAEAAGARTVRLKLERAGLKTYTHVAETSEGKRIRVRLGPFNSRAEAEKAAAKVKSLGLPAAILTL